MDETHERTYEDLVSGFSDSARERALSDLKRNFSVYGLVDGKPHWVNPDRTVTDTPKSCLLGEPEE